MHQSFCHILGEKLKINYLSPYLESSGSNFAPGVNFAIAGAATETTAVPIPLSTQVQQFFHFQNRTRELRPLGISIHLIWTISYLVPAICRFKNIIFHSLVYVVFI